MIPLGDWKWKGALLLFVAVAAAVVFVPLPHPPPPPAPAPAESSAPLPDPDTMLCYTVQDGDTAAGIARLFVVSLDEFRRVNGIAPGDDVIPGTKVWIPPAEDP